MLEGEKVLNEGRIEVRRVRLSGGINKIAWNNSETSLPSWWTCLTSSKVINECGGQIERPLSDSACICLSAKLTMPTMISKISRISVSQEWTTFDTVA